MEPIKTYANRDEFYKERGGRWSEERDFGVNNVNDLGWDCAGDSWTVQSRTSAPPLDGAIRVSVVCETGDIYAQGGTGHEPPVALLGRVPGATEKDIVSAVERSLNGWEDGDARRLSWFMERLDAIGP